MSKLLDSTVLVDLARENPIARDYVNTLKCVDDEQREAQRVVLSIVSAMELLVGCRNKREVRRIQKLLADYNALDLSPVIGRKAYELITRFSKSHGLGIPDALIAATALVEEAVLITANARHFDMIPGLPVETPY